MDAEAKLSQHRLDLMFSPDGGVYGRTGKDALDITNQTLPTFDKQAELLGESLTNQRQKDQFARIVNSQRGSLNQELNRYEFTQRNQYYDQVDQANIATSADAASKYANDPEQVAYYQSKGNFVIGEMGKRKGMPAEAILLEQQKFNSQVSVDVINRLATKDPVQAQQYYAANSQNMSADAQEKARSVLQVSVTNQMAGNMAANIFSGKGNTGAPGLVNLVVQAESGGNQAAVSPKGATGLMQLMPETAKEVSEQLGIPFSLERLASDPQYNMALGTEYLNRQVGRYDGNQMLAIAAYNAGPGMVDDWINGTNKTGKNDSGLKLGNPNKGEISNAEFMQRIPFKETRDYTMKIIGQATVPEQQTTKDPNSFEGRYAQGLAAATQIQNPALKKAFLDQLDDYKKAHTADLNAKFDSASDYVLQGGMASVPAELIAQLPADDRLKLQKMDDYRRKGSQPATNYDTFQKLLQMEPGALAQLSLNSFRTELNDADFNTVRTAWQAAQNGDGTKQAVAKGKEDVIKNGMAMVGIATGDSKDAKRPANLKKMDQYRTALQQQVDAFRVANGKEPNLQEVTSLANQLSMKVKLTGGGIFGTDTNTQLWEVAPEQMDNVVYSAKPKLQDIPASDRLQIIQTLRANGEEASEARIISEYVNRISGLGATVK